MPPRCAGSRPRIGPRSASSPFPRSPWCERAGPCTSSGPGPIPPPWLPRPRRCGYGGRGVSLVLSARLTPAPAGRSGGWLGVRARWPVHELWAGADPAAVAPAPTALRVWRAADFVVFHAPMDARADEALGRLMAGEPFAAACEAFADLPPADAAHEATALLLRWVEDGILARLA